MALDFRPPRCPPTSAPGPYNTYHLGKQEKTPRGRLKQNKREECLSPGFCFFRGKAERWLFKAEIWEQSQLNWKTTFRRTGEAQEWQTASPGSEEFSGNHNGRSSRPQAGLSGRISVSMWSAWPGWSQPDCFRSLSCASMERRPGLGGACGAQELGCCGNGRAWWGALWAAAWPDLSAAPCCPGSPGPEGCAGPERKGPVTGKCRPREGASPRVPVRSKGHSVIFSICHKQNGPGC